MVWGSGHVPRKLSFDERAVRHRKPLFFALLLFCFIALMFGFIFGPWFQVSKVSISSSGVLKNEEAVKLALYGASIQKIAFLHTANIFLVNPEVIETSLYKYFPEIKIVSISRRFPHEISAVIEERKEAALYCVAQEENTCYFIDEDGVAWKEAPEISGSVFIKIHGTKKPSQLGDEIIASSVIEAIFQVAERIQRENKFFIEEFIIVSSSEFDARSSVGFLFNMDANESIDGELNALFLVLEKEIPQEEWGNVEYIDLRIPNRVYYKLKTF